MAAKITNDGLWRVTYGDDAGLSREEIIKRQIGIFREVSDDLATRLEKATGVKGYPGISGLRFNGSHNAMADDGRNKSANGMNPDEASGQALNNGAPRAGSHKA